MGVGHGASDKRVRCAAVVHSPWGASWVRTVDASEADTEGRSSQHAADRSFLGEKPRLRFIELRNSGGVLQRGQADDDALTAFGARSRHTSEVQVG